MHRLLQILFRAALVISLVLLTGLLVLFTTVDFSGDAPEWWKWKTNDGRSGSVLLAKDKIEWNLQGPFWHEAMMGPVTLGRVHEHGDSNAWIVEHNTERFDAIIGGSTKTLSSNEWTLHTGRLFLLALIMPVCWLAIRVIRNLRAPIAGCCVECGYDLRATPERCPECGREASGSNA